MQFPKLIAVQIAKKIMITVIIIKVIIMMMITITTFIFGLNSRFLHLLM